MYGYGYYGWGMDPTILLLVIGMLLSLAASAKLRSTFAVYKKVRSHSGITGAIMLKKKAATNTFREAAGRPAVTLKCVDIVRMSGAV